ncbi:DUF2793 domain-containing protein [Pontixanthobacter aquaemixtae]|uniref:DUF2793 domain-containing protein n=1 Tax=Pontixanthobacter aquaemixtae TaxID=1958940 RepID=A0A844ZVC8_9SPHN|nr:DUF2793 domain-containing protein [Pontixanthobacter aquaemixtae]MXO91232.1 DUF2793 domain-containing protein [Pontixanthobacter aquaemixtae]
MVDPIEFTETTPRFKLPFLFTGQSQKEFYVNEAHAIADLLIHTAVVEELTSPPASPADGGIWLVGPGASGEWESHDGCLAGRQAGTWKFVTPVEGMRVFDESAGQTIIYKSGWIRPTAPDSPTTGAVADAELRIAFGELIETLRNAGIFPETS